MKQLILLICLSTFAHAQVVTKITNLPAKTAVSLSPGDVFPVVDTTDFSSSPQGTTKKLTLYDLVNMPPLATALAALASGGILVTPKAANYTVLTTDSGAFPVDTSGGNRVITLPLALNFLIGGISAELIFEKNDVSANTLTINTVGGDLLGGLTSIVLTKPWTSIRIYSKGAAGWGVE